MIESTFLGISDAFLKEVEVLAKKYDYETVFVMVGQPVGGGDYSFQAGSFPYVSEGMIDALEHNVAYGREMIEDEKREQELDNDD